MITAMVPLVKRLTSVRVISGSVSHLAKPDTTGHCPHQVSRGAIWPFVRLRLMSALKICILSSEIVPYAKTGGLADVAGALVRNLSAIGHEVRAFMPLYAAVRRTHAEIRPAPRLPAAALTIGDREYSFSLQTAILPGSAIAMYFIDCPALFERDGLYTNDADEHRRFLLFTRATLESCRLMGFAPHIFHCNDWHSIPALMLKTLYRSDAFSAGPNRS